jgi:DNA primase catalytic subunit
VRALHAYIPLDEFSFSNLLWLSVGRRFQCVVLDDTARKLTLADRSNITSYLRIDNWDQSDFEKPFAE